MYTHIYSAWKLRKRFWESLCKKAAKMMGFYFVLTNNIFVFFSCQIPFVCYCILWPSFGDSGKSKY